MWIPLHVHSQFSILDAMSSVKAIAEKAREFGQLATALTDHGNMFGAVDFYKACRTEGVKPIIGCELYVAPNSRFERKKERGAKTAFHLTLLAKNIEGYHNLCRLSSLGYLEGFYYKPRIDHELLEKYKEGLICLSGCMSSEASQLALKEDKQGLQELIDWYRKLFGQDFYIELQRHHMTEENLQKEGIVQEAHLLQNYQDCLAKQKRLNEILLDAASKNDVKVVATNDSHYNERDDWKAHEIVLNIQSGEPAELWEKDSTGNPTFKVPNPRRRTYPSHEFYLKSPKEMIELFSDIPDAIENTLEVSEKCFVELDFKSKHYPVFIPPSLEDKSFSKKERKKEVEEFLLQLCEEGIKKRYTKKRLDKIKEIIPGKDPVEVVRERLKLEMSVIAPKGMCDYLLIVWDFIHWAKEKGIPVGPGRGSGAGSIILYLIGITDIEPIRFNLFFERFINPERVSYPDIDVDICMERRGDVIHYTLEKYGKDNVAQIITFNTMKTKMVIRDVGRVLSVPLSKVNKIAKLVPDDLNITMKEALEKDHDLNKMYTEDEETKRIFDLGVRIEGTVRNSGIHAAGLVVSGQPLIDLIPVSVAKDANLPVTQYSMKPVEQVGMLKIDFLGLKTLTAIKSCVEAIKVSYGIDIDWIDLPLDDKKSFALLNQGKTLGVFQLESSGMQDLARQLHLDKFEEIIAVSALYRPGPMDMIPSFIKRKHGKESIEYDHPWMKDILSETYGIMVYQEQVMQIASKLANYSLGEGDVLRRAMGKKDQKQMSKERDKFRSGCIDNGIDEQTAAKIFDKMEKFAAYGFNKSHAAAYSYIAYVTAYLKANYPKEWMAALMSCDSHDLTKVAKFIRECRAMNIDILPPDVNEAGVDFIATGVGVRFAMSGIKGVGEGVVEAIVAERVKNGPFENFFQFFKRIDTSRVGKKVIENLVDAGSFDFTGWSRDQLRLKLEPMFETAIKEKKEEQAGVVSLFSLIDHTSEKHFEKPPVVKFKTAKNDILLREKELLGFFLTGHPMDDYMQTLKRVSSIPLRAMEEMDSGTIFRSAFIVEEVKVRFSAKTSKKFAILTISDGLVAYELPIWPDQYQEKHTLILENQLLFAVLQVDKDEGAPRLRCHWIDDLTKTTREMIDMCDRAYDKAKYQRDNFNRRKKMTKPVEKPKELPKQLIIGLDLDRTTHSQILTIGEILQKHIGESSVQVEFTVGGKKIKSLHISKETRVHISKDLQSKLEEIDSINVVS